MNRMSSPSFVDRFLSSIGGPGLRPVNVGPTVASSGDRGFGQRTSMNCLRVFRAAVSGVVVPAPLRFHGWVLDRPIIVTNRCADSCSQELGLDRERARKWVAGLIYDHGRVTNRLPSPIAGRRSPSGYFALVEGVLALPLAEDRNGASEWVATNCVFFPDYRRRYGVAAAVDPFTISGPALLEHVNLSSHAVERFQQCCAGHPDPEIAEAELRHNLALGAHAVREPPAWCRTRKADFYLVAFDEFCLPMSRNVSRGRPFDALTCMHRASDLFGPDTAALAGHCRPDPQAFPEVGPERGALTAAFAGPARLSWHRPRWAADHPRARFWIIFSDWLVAPVAWEPDLATRPLIVLDLVEQRSPLRRLRRSLPPGWRSFTRPRFRR
jgi:hypothetical protein